MAGGQCAQKVWMSIKEHGLDRFGRMMQRNVEPAHYLGSLIAAAAELELIAAALRISLCWWKKY